MMACEPMFMKMMLTLDVSQQIHTNLVRPWTCLPFMETREEDNFIRVTITKTFVFSSSI